MKNLFKALVCTQIILIIKSQFLDLPKPDHLRKLESIQQSKIKAPSDYTYYEVLLNLGENNKKQQFKVVIDLTQSETWVKEYSCNSSSRLLQEEHTDSNLSTSEASIESSKSSTISSCTDRNYNAKIESIYGQLEGKVISESASIGESIMAKNMSIISVSQQSAEKYFYNNTKLQGILGLSYKSFSGKHFSFIDVLKETLTISKRVFSLGKNTFHVGDYPSEVKQFKQNYHTCNITMSEGFSEELMDGWICDLTHFLIGDSNNFVDAEEIQGRVIFDSMFRSIEAPDRFVGIVKAHYFDINYNDKNCTLETDSENELTTRIVCYDLIENPKDFNFIIGGYALIIPGNKLFTNVQVTENVNDKTNVKTVSFFNISFTEKNHNIWRFGKIFLDEYMIVFDYEKAKIGFYGENKINFEKEWTEWWNSGFESITSQEHMKYLVIASVCLGAALLFVIICLVCQGFKKKDDEGKAPLQEENEREMENH